MRRVGAAEDTHRRGGGGAGSRTGRRAEGAGHSGGSCRGSASSLRPARQEAVKHRAEIPFEVQFTVETSQRGTRHTDGIERPLKGGGPCHQRSLAGEPHGVLTSLSSLFLRLSRPENTPLPSLLGVRGRGDDEPLWTGVSGERVGG